MRIGFIGVGGIAQGHLRNLEAMEDVRIAAVCDLDPERLRQAAERYGAAAYTDFDELLASERLDGVYVCIPPFAHPAPERAAIERGIPVFIEKPVGLDLDAARRVLDLCKQKDALTAVGYQWRYTGGIDRVLERVAQEPVGMVLGFRMGSLPATPWWRVKAKSGGQEVEQTTHQFDLARYLAGEVEEVYAAQACRLLGDVPGFATHDVGAVTLKFKSGAVGNFASTCALGKTYRLGLTLVLKGLAIEIDKEGVHFVASRGAEEHIPAGSPNFEADRAFIHAIRTGDRSQIRCDYEEGVKTLALTLAVNESAERGVPVAPAAV